MKTKTQRKTRRFKNSEPFKIKLFDAWRWHRHRKVLPPKTGYLAFNQTWFEKIDLTLAGDRMWWIGHSTTLVCLADKMILTDPVFSKRVSPVQFAGPKRRTPPALLVEQLPQIDFTVISHSHYDHLDYQSMKKLITRFPNMVIMVPLGLKRKLQRWGAKQVIELNWWDFVTINGITFTAVPARHWSNRGIFDTNKSLWCGWVIQSNVTDKKQSKTVYFMGDTGYSSSLKEIGERFRCIDLAMIPIGAYAPRWFMHLQHIDPKQAVQLYDELNCHCAIAIHWGTFELADEPLDEPPQLLNANKGNRSFHLIKIGGSQAINRIDSEVK